tara:strand:- start:183 stop:1157 length:975 start_codon:yes stop_codon:yes gene_type:complete
MTITNKLKTIAKAQINNIIQRIPVSDLRSILAPRGVLIFENERDSHLHTLSMLHGALRREFREDDVAKWRSDFGYRGEAIRYLSNTNSSRSWEFDIYSGASVVLLRELYIPGEEPPPVQLPELDDSVQSWNAQHGTEFVLIDESELSDLQDQAAAWNRRELESDIESITNDATELEGEVRDLRQMLDERLSEIDELKDRTQQLQGELDNWHSLGSGYGINYDVSDVERKLELLNERTEQLNEWEDLISRGMQPSEIEEIIDEADEWIELCSDTGMQACEIQQELDRLEELDADFEHAKNRLSSAQSKAIEIGLVWRSLEIALDC